MHADRPRHVGFHALEPALVDYLSRALWRRWPGLRISLATGDDALARWTVDVWVSGADALPSAGSPVVRLGSLCADDDVRRPSPDRFELGMPTTGRAILRVIELAWASRPAPMR